MNKVSVLLLLHSKGQVACLRLRAGRRSRSMHSRFRLHNLGGGKKKSKHLPRPEKCCHKPVTKRATRIFQGAEKKSIFKVNPFGAFFLKVTCSFPPAFFCHLKTTASASAAHPKRTWARGGARQKASSHASSLQI